MTVKSKRSLGTTLKIKFQNLKSLEEMDTFLNTNDLLELNQENISSIIRLNINNNTETVIKQLTTKKTLRIDRLTH